MERGGDEKTGGGCCNARGTKLNSLHPEKSTSSAPPSARREKQSRASSLADGDGKKRKKTHLDGYDEIRTRHRTEARMHESLVEIQHEAFLPRVRRYRRRQKADAVGVVPQSRILLHQGGGVVTAGGVPDGVVGKFPRVGGGGARGACGGGGVVGPVAALVVVRGGGGGEATPPPHAPPPR